MTAGELLEGKRLEAPPTRQTSVTFRARTEDGDAASNVQRRRRGRQLRRQSVLRENVALYYWSSLTTYQKLLAVADFAKGSLTVVIAAIAVYIAFEQWKANERRLVLDRYDRRFRIYQRVIEFISLACHDFKPPFAEIQSFYRDTMDAEFLFGPEIAVYLNEVRKHAIESEGAHREYCDMTMVPPAAYDHNDVTRRMHEHSVWLTHQFDVAREKFRKYLDISR